jgi:hypothetical protein
MDASCTLACPRVGALTLGRGCDRRPTLERARSRTAHTPLLVIRNPPHGVALHTPLSLSLSTRLTVSRCYMGTSHHWGRQLHTFSPLADFSLACPKSKCSHIRRGRQLCDRLSCRPAAHLWARHTVVTATPTRHPQHLAAAHGYSQLCPTAGHRQC